MSITRIYTHNSCILKTLTSLLFSIATGCVKAQCIVDSVKVDCGSASIYFERQRYDTTAFFTLVHVHENETTALQAAEWLLDSVRQGSLITWRGQRQRLVDFSFGSKNLHFDPNRIYTPAGIENTIGPYGSDTTITAVQSAADTFLSHFIRGKDLIIALHNNTNEGKLSVKSYGRGGIYSEDAQVIYINPRQDADDFFYTTDEQFFKALKNEGFNIVLQKNETVTDDGSLSVFCARQGIPYINIEAEIGHIQEQKKMLRSLWACLQSRININKPDKGLKDN